MPRPTSLKKNLEAVLTECGSDPRLADLLLRSLRRRGVTLVLGLDHCHCFPRTKEPRKQDGVWVCQLCQLRIDSTHEARVKKELGA